MHFRIFIPRDKATPGASKAPLYDVGLGHLATNFIGENRHEGTSIEGKTGILYHWQQPGDMKFAAEELTWIPALPFRGLPAERYLVGYDPTKLPTPRELLVPLPIPGDALPLSSDGYTWIIPNVLFLPAAVVLTADGVKLERLGRYQQRSVEGKAWIAECEDFIEFLKQDRAEHRVEWERAWAFAYDGLILNYRLTPEVVNLLNILATDNLKSIILAAVGAYELHRQEIAEQAPQVQI